MELTLNNDILKFEDDSTLQVVLESVDLINKKRNCRCCKRISNSKNKLEQL